MAVEIHNQTFKHYHTSDYLDLGENSLVEAVFAYRDLTGHWPAEIVINSKFQVLPNQVVKVRDPIGLEQMMAMTHGEVKVTYSVSLLSWEVKML